MNNLEYGLEGLKFVLVVSALWAAYALGLRRAVLADWRQDLFAIRNQLWDKMRASGHLQHPAHIAVRDRINALLRAGPVINLPYVVAILSVRLDGEKAGPKLSVQLGGIDDDAARVELERAVVKVHRLLVKRISFDTLPGCLIGWPVWLVYTVARHAKLIAGQSIKGMAGTGAGVGHRVTKWAMLIAARAEERVAAEECADRQMAKV